VDHSDFLTLAAHVSNRCLTPGNEIGNLVLTNGPEGQLREPQLRHLWANEADKKNIKYSFESPTSQKYSFSGTQEKAVSGRHDLVLYLSEPPRQQVLIELKHALSAKTIKQDLVKLLRETTQDDVVGCAVMFVAESTKVGLERLSTRLPEVIRKAWNDPHLTDQDREALLTNKKWFEMLIVVREGQNRETYRSGEITISTLLASHAKESIFESHKGWADEWLATH